VPAQLAGRVRAEVLERDPFLRLHAVGAVRALGFAVADEEDGAHPLSPRPTVLFIGLDRLGACSRCGPRGLAPAGDASSPLALVVGYGSGAAALLAAHRQHGCTDLVLALRVIAGRPRLVHLPLTATDAARLTPREADVLVLLLGGLSTMALASRLGISPGTARSHCRAVLRKCGAADRRALRVRFLDAG
jgi:DNA-binding CsgD family transcriptional regulator